MNGTTPLVPFGDILYLDHGVLSKPLTSVRRVSRWSDLTLIPPLCTDWTEFLYHGECLNIDEPLAILRSGATNFYNVDRLGTITSLANTSGSLAQTYSFDSFGNPTASSGSLTNWFQYTVREFDTENSLYYYRARYYDASVGRFLKEDTSWSPRH